jgi:DNA-binding NarL/FixJ family response regulator
MVRERLAQATASPNGGDDPGVELTRRELEVLRLVAAGNNTRALAERLQVSRATVRNHVQNILSKLGVHSRLEAAAYATRHRLL